MVWCVLCPSGQVIEFLVAWEGARMPSVSVLNGTWFHIAFGGFFEGNIIVYILRLRSILLCIQNTFSWACFSFGRMGCVQYPLLLLLIFHRSLGYGHDLLNVSRWCRFFLFFASPFIHGWLLLGASLNIYIPYIYPKKLNKVNIILINTSSAVLGFKIVCISFQLLPWIH